MTLTTADEKLCKILEPNVSTTEERVNTLKEFQKAKIPTVVWLSPFLPFINDTKENIDALLDYCVKSGVKGIICFNIGVTLRNGDREYFYSQLDRFFPGMKERYMRTYGNSYEVLSPNSDYLMKRLKMSVKMRALCLELTGCFSYLRKYENQNIQLSLFDNL